ncbi:MAG TPA: BON domain-containing protein [Acidobacteriaceae bacterium]|nr:BON domain-containing protein [Acidobacteriaceae bacterium]
MSSFSRRFTGAASALALAVLLAPAPARAQRNDSKIQSDAQHELRDKRFNGVQVQVHDGVVRLTGEVNTYADKEEAAKKVEHMHEAANIQNDINVGGQRGASNVSDEELQRKLAKALAYDRVGYGTTMFNAITLQVHNGVVTLGGVVYGPPDKDSALSLVKNTPGVRDVIDHIQVAPPSPMDDRIRHEEARSIYGFPQLNRYALNPAKPIRIVVVNGHVTLAGTVDSKGDKDVAGIRANSVPGVFSVQNDLQVAGQNER